MIVYGKNTYALRGRGTLILSIYIGWADFSILFIYLFFIYLFFFLGGGGVGGQQK